MKKTVDSFEIRAEYTGTDPNLRPAASAFAMMIKKITNPDGTFTDQDLEEEYQNWLEQNKPASAATLASLERNAV